MSHVDGLLIRNLEGVVHDRHGKVRRDVVIPDPLRDRVISTRRTRRPDDKNETPLQAIGARFALEIESSILQSLGGANQSVLPT